jgi:iron complex outermembrane receptor protein
MHKIQKAKSGVLKKTVVALCIGSLYGSAAMAQSTAPAGIEEIIVTAQKRSERVQDVPIAISAFTASQIENKNIGSLLDLSSLAPNLSVAATPGNSTASQVSIRGGVTTNPALFWDTAVGMYVDGVYIGKTQGSIFKMIDLQRVEVLRGPQGTLYGRNSMSGAINFITKKPLGELAGEASVTVGNYNEKIVKASLDLPKIGIASASIGVRSEKKDGWVNTTPGSSTGELNNSNQQQARIAVHFDIAPDLKADYKFDISNVDQAPTHSQLYRADIPSLAPYVFKNRQTTASVDGPLFEISKVQGHALTADYQINANNSLKSITSSRKMTWEDALDLDGSPQLVAHTQRLSDYSQFSQELQWVGKANQLNYVLGAYYFKDDGFTRNPQNYFGGTFNFDSNYGFTTKSTAFFSQVDYSLSERLTLTGGLRRTNETKTIDRQLGFNGSIGAAFIPLVPKGTTAAADFSATTPLAIASFKLTPTTNVYFKYAEGFKSGGFNGEYGVVNPSPAGIASNVAETKTPFKPEMQKTFELGAKYRFASGLGYVNAALFQNKINDLQLAIFTADGAAASVIRNAGKATTKGFELESSYLFTQDFRANMSYGYLDAKYDEFMDGGVNVAANRAYVHAPKNSFNLGVDWKLANTAWGPLRLIADYIYKDAFFAYPFQLASSGTGYNAAAQIAKNTQIAANGELNARLQLSDIQQSFGKIQLSLWARNLTNTNHIANYIDFGPGFGNLTQAYFNQPRTFGITATAKW